MAGSCAKAECGRHSEICRFMDVTAVLSLCDLFWMESFGMQTTGVHGLLGADLSSSYV